MTTLTLTTITMPAADLGEENMQPDIKNIDYIHAGYKCTDKITEQEKAHFGKGMIKTILPYTILDNYNRDRKMRDFPAVILENDYLKATFLPTLGGRLWSLYDKRLKRELLYVNSVFQPANLGIRNAWFSGGVEFNVGIKGHNPLTCDPLFVETAESETGEPILRLYEYERIRDVVYSVEAYLPSDKGVLYLRDTIENTSTREKYTYWWSNIAVKETSDTRIIVPADEAFLCFYNEGNYLLDKTSIPMRDGVDYSYVKNSKCAQDFFYKIPENRNKWIAAVEADGKGIIQFSQSKMIGRKLFVWGQGAGGRHWAEFLSNPGESYVEIQAGLAYTQLEHPIIKAGECMQWIEGYFAADCNPEDVRGSWQVAQSAIEEQINKYVPIDFIDAKMAEIFPKKLINRKIIQYGSGWGYIEAQKRKLLGQPRLSKIYDFPSDSVTEKEKPWLGLLLNGRFEQPQTDTPPKSYMACSDFIPFAQKAADNWYGALQLGILYYANHMVAQAKEAMEKSLALQPTAWSLRNLAMIAMNEENDISAAVKYILRAIELNNTDRGLVINCAQVLTAANKYEKWLEIYEKLPEKLKNDGRILFYCAMAHLRMGDAQSAAEIITPDFVMCDVKEGEVSISNLWFEIYHKLTGEDKYPLPFSLDFRMDQ